jgi:omega-6 fatty acid desaturase (delta-12 desaturase)
MEQHSCGGAVATAPDIDQAHRQGPALIRATQPFEAEFRARSWWLLTQTFAALAVLLTIAASADSLFARIPAAILAGLVQVRLFIFYHDALHGAIFRRSSMGQGLMSVVGWYVLMVRSVWQETHDHHHQHNGRMLGSTIGTYPILSLELYRGLDPAQRRRYHLIRHPLAILFGGLTVMVGGMVIAPLFRQPRRHWQGAAALITQIGIVILLALAFSPMLALCVIVIPAAVAMGVGAYLFYAQHNFPAMRVAPRSAWTFTGAALGGSSMFDMGPIMRWLTGNIGFHHIHHVNHRIPFYRLPEAMAAIPELQQPGRTSWRLRDIRDCLRLLVWDAESGRMLSKRETRARL